MNNHLVVGHQTAPRAVIAFSAFSVADDPILAAWARFRAPLATVPDDQDEDTALAPGEAVQPRRGRLSATTGSGESRGFWRLVARNNRELGRSFHLYSGVTQAHEHVALLQHDPDALVVDIVSGARTGSRGWLVRLGDRPVMTCSRWYESASTGREAAAGALRAFAHASFAIEPDRRGSSGRFRRSRPAKRGVDA